MNPISPSHPQNPPQAPALGFYKYEACQNDFVLFEAPVPQLTPDWVQALCARHTGIGADGVITLSPPSAIAPFHMRIFNADGSEPEMCGNAVRCAVKHLVDRGLVGREQPLLLSTAAGVLSARYDCGAAEDCGAAKDGGEADDGVTAKDSVATQGGAAADHGAAAARARSLVTHVTVDMRPPRAPIRPQQVVLGHEVWSGLFVSMGNPHFVVHSSAPLQDAQRVGQALCLHPDFPHGANISFVRTFKAEERCELVVYERGVGITQACGSGACATVAAALFEGMWEICTPIQVALPGGTLTITATPTELLMSGPVRLTFKGHLPGPMAM